MDDDRDGLVILRTPEDWARAAEYEKERLARKARRATAAEEETILRKYGRSRHDLPVEQIQIDGPSCQRGGCTSGQRAVEQITIRVGRAVKTVSWCEPCAYQMRRTGVI